MAGFQLPAPFLQGTSDGNNTPTGAGNLYLGGLVPVTVPRANSANPSNPNYYGDNVPSFSGVQNSVVSSSPPTDPTTQALANIINSNQQDADVKNWESGKFNADLPGYIGTQVGAATDVSKYNLANDINNARRSTNARGLLNSGITNDQESQAAAMEGSKLDQEIQGINTNANEQAQVLQQQATSAQQNVDQEAGQYASLIGTNQAGSYNSALTNSQNQNNYTSSMIEGGVGVGALVGTAFGPVGTLIGAGLGGLIGWGASEIF